jgi:hypothetical protein
VDEFIGDISKMSSGDSGRFVGERAGKRTCLRRAGISMGFDAL